MSKKKLTAADIAEELQVSPATAYRLMAQMTRLVVGRSVRVSREAFDRYLRRQERTPCNDNDSTAAAKRGGARSKTIAGNGGADRRADGTGAPPKSSPRSSSERPRIRPVMPHTRPSSKGSNDS